MGERLAKVEQGLDDHLRSCKEGNRRNEEAQAKLLDALRSVSTRLWAMMFMLVTALVGVLMKGFFV